MLNIKVYVLHDEAGIVLRLRLGRDIEKEALPGFHFKLKPLFADREQIAGNHIF